MVNVRLSVGGSGAIACAGAAATDGGCGRVVDLGGESGFGLRATNSVGPGPPDNGEALDNVDLPNCCATAGESPIDAIKVIHAAQVIRVRRQAL